MGPPHNKCINKCIENDEPDSNDSSNNDILSAIGLVILTIIVGMIGFKYFGNLTMPDAFLNSTLILTTMGPGSTDWSDQCKIFCGFFALICGFIIFYIISIIIARVLST